MTLQANELPRTRGHEALTWVNASGSPIPEAAATMMTLAPPDLTTELLAPEQARIVFPLMQQALPELTLPAWLTYVRSVETKRSPPPRGVIVARRIGHAHLSGAVCYTRTRNVQLGSVLTAEHIIALDLLRPRDVLAVLIDALASIADELGSSGARVIVHSGWPGLAEDLQALGHRPDGIVMVR
jgi:hypothetical protein